MPEATVLYSVTGAVLVGLVVWVAMVLQNAKEPWKRPPPAELPAEEEAAVPAATPAPAPAKKPEIDADDTARATPVALSEGRTKAANEVAADETDEEKKSEEA